MWNEKYYKLLNKRFEGKKLNRIWIELNNSTITIETFSEKSLSVKCIFKFLKLKLKNTLWSWLVRGGNILGFSSAFSKSTFGLSAAPVSCDNTWA